MCFFFIIFSQLCSTPCNRSMSISNKPFSVSLVAMVRVHVCAVLFIRIKYMKVELKKTKRESKKKYSVRFLDGPHKDKIVYFGGKGYSDYTIHGNPERMRLYVRRHRGLVPKSTMREINPDKIHEKMLRVGRSGKEDWTADGVDTAGFWSRWLLWSQPSMSRAKEHITSRFVVVFA